MCTGKIDGRVSDILLVTPDNWFALAHASREAPGVRPALSDAAGHTPLSTIPLDELRALHFTFGSWWAIVGEPFLRDSRALLRRRAEAAQADLDGEARRATTLLGFPDLAHPALAESPTAIALLRQFFWLPHSPSLLAWARALARDPRVPALAAQHPWLRVLLQKAAAEDDDAGAVACLRAVYEGDDRSRALLLDDEASVLAGCGMPDLGWMAGRLGLARPARTDRGVVIPPPQPPGAAPPDVTVLVPAYKHEHFIGETLASVLAQTHTAFRVVVVDDRSPDDTVARARAITDARLQVTVNDANIGLGDSVLRALDTVDTPFVALLNSDDLFHPARLARCLAAFAAAPGAQVVATGFVNIDADGRRLTTGTVRRLFDGGQIADWVQWQEDTGQVAPGADLFAALLERNFLVTSSNIVARTSFLRAHREALRGVKYCLDWQVFLEAAAADALVVVPDALLAYRLHGSNTVWFDDDARAAYRLEVNRVLADTLRLRRDRAIAAGDSDAALAAWLDDLVTHATRHSETRGLALYANALVGSRRLETGRERAADVHQQVRALTASAGVTEAAAAHGLAAVAATALSDVQREEHAAALASHESTVAHARQQAVEFEAQREAAQQDRDAAHHARDAATSERDAARAERDATARARDLAAAAHEAAVAEHEAAAAARDAALAARDHALGERDRAVAARADAIAQLRGSPEWLLGDRIWNRWGGARIGGPMVKGLHALKDVRNRGALALGRLAHRAGLGRPRAIVAACWSFPIHSQTFVYQEMTALAWAGFDTTVFCCDTNPRQELPAAFSGLWDQRLVMQTDWAINQRDLDHFMTTRPARVEALLTVLGQATGLTREALLHESIVRTGFTFARHAELAGATYIHTYFFYDQSFLGLIAAFLLQIPRGITAYADHMLGDYAFKLVPLHLELADIVVATSRRIKTELGEIGGGRFDDKILVKPNGIDVARFPFVAPEARLALAGVPEVIAVNRIEPKKGLIHLIDALALLRDSGTPVRLNLIGGADVHTPASADCQRELLARIEALQLGDLVVLHGVKQQHEFPPIVARSRLFVAPYVEVHSGDKDGIPTAVLEALSSGLPVIRTDAGSLHECVEDGVEGLAVPQRDAEALARAVARVLGDPALFTRLSQAARQRAVGEFDIHVTELKLHERIRARIPLTPRTTA